VHRLAASFQNYLHFPKPDPLYALVGALAGTMMNGYPVWLMLVGPSACGKTTLLESLLVLDHVAEVDTVSGEAAFLSGTKEKERAKDSKGGLLKSIGDRGMMVLSDFSTILSRPDSVKDEIMNVFRRVYDGRFTRDVGTDGGQHLHWTGRIGLAAGCTDAIDRQSNENAEMGQRCIFWRYPQSAGWQEANKALQTTDPDDQQQGLQQAMMEFITASGLAWGEPCAIRRFSQSERNRLIAAAQFIAASRSGVTRDRFRRDITDVQSTEFPTRVASELEVMYAGMEKVGCTEEEIWRVVAKVGKDCMPQKKRKAYEAVVGGATAVNMVAYKTQVSVSETRRTLEDLMVHGLLKQDEGGWHATAWAKELMDTVWGPGGFDS
jgi:ABC-type dipeptide/oligopeptide/nickel transport system ATPase component